MACLKSLWKRAVTKLLTQAIAPIRGTQVDCRFPGMQSVPDYHQHAVQDSIAVDHSPYGFIHPLHRSVQLMLVPIETPVEQILDP